MNINATFFAELLAFCIFVFITYRYIWPSMENLLEDRRKEISDGLEAASQSQRKLEEANTESSKILDEAKAEASNLINQAGSRGDQIIDEAKNQAVEEQKKIKASAEADIEQNINKAKEGLKQELSALVDLGLWSSASSDVRVRIREIVKEINNDEVELRVR